MYPVRCKGVCQPTPGQWTPVRSREYSFPMDKKELRTLEVKEKALGPKHLGLTASACASGLSYTGRWSACWGMTRGRLEPATRRLRADSPPLHFTTVSGLAYVCNHRFGIEIGHQRNVGVLAILGELFHFVGDVGLELTYGNLSIGDQVGFTA